MENTFGTEKFMPYTYLLLRLTEKKMRNFQLGKKCIETRA